MTWNHIMYIGASAASLYQTIGVIVAIATFLSLENVTRGQRVLTSIIHGIAWPWVLYQHFQKKD